MMAFISFVVVLSGLTVVTVFFIPPTPPSHRLRRPAARQPAARQPVEPHQKDDERYAIYYRSWLQRTRRSDYRCRLVGAANVRPPHHRASRRAGWHSCDCQRGGSRHRFTAYEETPYCHNTAGYAAEARRF
jgi:hypothetical protein